ncbi:MAG: trypsin-like peptidase domain-containing protein [Planctomycetota bacterium]
MSARIRFQGGPLAGRIYVFEDDQDSIVVGRDPDRCDVVLPPELTAVGREHLELRRSLGRYRVRHGADHPVLLDGKPILNDTELPEVAALQLGPEGPVMVVQTLGAATVPPTIDHTDTTPDVPTLLVDVVERSRVNRRIAAFTALVLLVLAVVGVLAFRDTGARVRDVSDEQVRVRAMLASEASTRETLAEEQRRATQALAGHIEGLDRSIEKIQPDVSGLRKAVAGMGPRMQGMEERVARLGPRIRSALQAAAPSVYLVMVRKGSGLEAALGSAWVAKKGTLVTNAHVGRAFETIRKDPRFADAELFVRAPGPRPRDHDVVRIVTHPGWQVFRKLWEEYRPTDVDLAGHLNPLVTSGAADVALLEVTGGDDLAPTLLIAPQEDLERLKAGDVVGSVGYPSEDMASGGVNPARPSPTTQIAHITAMTNFFLAPDEPSGTLLVQHSLPAAGGASGSPILDENGHVVAVLNAGNVTVGGLGQRIPSAVLVNFAQRADLVRELLDGTAAKHQVARTKRWREGIRTFTSLRAAVEKNALAYLESYLAAVRKKAGVEPERIRDEQGILGSALSAPPPVTSNDLDLALPGRGTYVFFVYAAMGRRVGLTILDPKDRKRVLDRVTADHFFAVIQIAADAKADVRVRVTGFSDTEYRLQVWRF